MPGKLQANVQHRAGNFKVHTEDLSAGLKKAGFNAKLLTRLVNDNKKGGFRCDFFTVENNILVAISSGVPSEKDIDRFNGKLLDFLSSGEEDPSLVWESVNKIEISLSKQKILLETFSIILTRFTHHLLVGEFNVNYLSSEPGGGKNGNAFYIPEFADSTSDAINKILRARTDRENGQGTRLHTEIARDRLEKMSKDELIQYILDADKNQKTRISELNQLVSNIDWDEDVQEFPADIPEDDPYYELARGLSQLRHEANKMVMELTDLNKNLEFRVAERIVELIEKESNLRAILDNSTDATCLTDFRNQLIDFNITFSKEITKRFGVKPEVKGNFLDLFNSENDRSEWADRLEKALDGKPGIYIDQYLRGEDMKVYEVKTFPISKTGIAHGVAIFIKDITHIQRSELKYIEKNRELDRINKELDNFVYRVSHDLRAPITSIMGLINLIKLEDDPEKLNNYISLQEKSVQKLDHFIKDIINLSRNTRLGITVERINFDRLVHEIFTELDDGTGAVDKRLSVNEVVPFYSDRQRIHTILTNLVSNSIKFYNNHQETPFVHVNLISDEDNVTIEVKDNGIGIPPEYLSKIYTMFFRAAKDNPGSGLGLYIVKETINKLKGNITARSKLREGTTFTIKIPNLIKRYEAAPKLL